MANQQPYWVCDECGYSYGMRNTTGGIATWHLDDCGVCYRFRQVTEPRDFGYLNEHWLRHTHY